MSFILFPVAAGFRVLKTIPLDDAYITFSYSINLASGNGFVFNDNYATWGTTTPLFTLLLSLFGLFVDELLLPARIIDFMSLAGQVICGCLVLRKCGLAVWQPFFPLFMIYFLIHGTSYPGMEYGLYAFCNVGALTCILYSNWLVAALFASLAPVIRIDGGLTWIIVLAAWLFHTRGRERTLPFLGILCFLPACWYLFALVRFGSVFPQTLGTRRQEATVWGTFGSFWWRSLIDPTAFRLMLIPSLLGIFSAAGNNRKVFWFMLYGFCYICMYSLFQLPGLSFYLCTINLVLLIFLAVWLGTLVSNISRRSKPLPYTIPALAVSLSMIASDAYLSSAWWRGLYAADSGEIKYAVYKGIGHWIRHDLDPEATWACNEIGITGYYGRNDLIEIGGLVNPEGVPYVPDRYVELVQMIDADVIIVPQGFHGVIEPALSEYRTLGSFSRKDELTISVLVKPDLYTESLFLEQRKLLADAVTAVDGL